MFGFHLKNIAIEYDGCRYHNGKKSNQKKKARRMTI